MEKSKLLIVAVIISGALVYSTSNTKFGSFDVEVSPETYQKVQQLFGGDEVLVEEPSRGYEKKVQPIIETLKKHSDHVKDGTDLANLYLAYAKGLETKLDDEYVIKRVEDVEVSNRIAGKIQVDIKGKYEDLDKQINEVVLNSLVDSKGIVKSGNLTESQRENLVEAFKAVAWACSEGAK